MTTTMKNDSRGLFLRKRRKLNKIKLTLKMILGHVQQRQVVQVSFPSPSFSSVSDVGEPADWCAKIGVGVRPTHQCYPCGP